MSERNGYDPGVPCWVDLSSTDVPASVRFYGELFGWTAEMSEDPAAGGYGQFHYNGKSVAGIGPVMMPGAPTAWNVYVNTDDVQATAERVKSAGGQVVMEPMQVLDAGWMGLFQDPAGGFFSAWQPGEHKGAELVNEPYSFSWNQYTSRDPEAARAFFSAVFGWTHEIDESGPQPYTTWMLDGNRVAGMVQMGPEYPPEVPAHWVTYFAVADVQDSFTKAEGLGATPMVPPMNSPMGPMAFLVDPQGGLFAMIQLNETA